MSDPSESSLVVSAVRTSTVSGMNRRARDRSHNKVTSLRREVAKMAPAVELRHVSKRFSDVAVLKQIDLAVNRGEILALLGPSGSGKSTILNLIAGFFPPDEGTILLDGVPVDGIPTHRRNLGMVFQNYSLFPHLTIFDNVAFGLTVRKQSQSEIKERVTRALDLVRLADLAGRFPAQLSGGQQQRIAVARALVVNPRVLLCDEPLSNLDAKLRKEMQVELKRIQRETKTTMIYVTHDQEEAVTLADRVGLLRAGRLEQLADPHTVFEFPQTRFAAEFMGYTNVFPGRVVGSAEHGATVHLERGPQVAVDAKGLASTGPVTVCVREERVRIEPMDATPIDQSQGGLLLDEAGDSIVVGTVDDLAYTGMSFVVFVRHRDQMILRVRLPIQDMDVRRITIGSTVRLVLPRDHMRVVVGD